MHQRNFWKRLLSVISFLLFSYAMHNAHASGFGIFTQSASSLGQGSAVVAHTDSPSTIFFNPALMNRLDGTQIELGTTLLFPHREFKSASSGNTFEAKDEVFFPSTFFITHKFNQKFSAGLGVFNPFGLGSDWGDSWEGRYLATKSEMTTFDINPSISFQITPILSIGVGIDILILDTTLQNKINLTALNQAFGNPLGTDPLPDVGQKFKGDGTGIGYNIGILFDATKDISLGASYRSEIKVGIKGQGTFDQQIPGVLENSSGRADIKLPQQVFAGIAYKGFAPLTLETGMRWEGWSSFKQLQVNFANGTSVTQPRNWKDTFAFTAGAQYKFNDMVTLRGGYLYGRNPVPDSTFEPAIPDSDTHLFCIGTGLNFKQFGLDLAYAYQMQDDRTKNNNISDLFGATANGHYTTDIHLLAASLKYKF
jgi:long-chain fatty acid transport protein